MMCGDWSLCQTSDNSGSHSLDELMYGGGGGGSEQVLTDAEFV